MIKLAVDDLGLCCLGLACVACVAASSPPPPPPPSLVQDDNDDAVVGPGGRLVACVAAMLAIALVV